MRAMVTGWSIHVPDLAEDGLAGGVSVAPACPPERATTLLGRKGLLYKEPATRLALCAVHRALGLAPGEKPAPGSAADPAVAVVASSNLGNVGTVATVARTVAEEGVRAVSPMDAPNVSSNVIASTVAIWFRLAGPNLMLCSGHPSGLDAIRLAQLLLAAGRARRVVVVGAEPADPVATGLFCAGPAGRPALRAAAACVVLEPAGRSAQIVIEPVADHDDGSAVPRRAGETLIAPEEFGSGAGEQIDLTARIGSTYGALGVLQAAVAAQLLSGGGAAAVRIACGNVNDGVRSALVLRHKENR